MTSLFTHQKTKKLNKKRYALSFIMLAALIIASVQLKAQNILIGLTSNGSIEGKGVHFQFIQPEIIFLL